MVFHGFPLVFHVFYEVLGPECRPPVAALCRPVAACAAQRQRIGSPIRNISGGLEELADRREEGIGRTEDIEDFLEGLRT